MGAGVSFLHVSAQRDREGRIVLVRRSTGGKMVTIAFIYGLMTTKTNYILGCSPLWQPMPITIWCLGVDFNAPMEQAVDRSHSMWQPMTSPPFLTQGLDLKLTDVWRNQHREDRDYTHYSHVHRSHSLPTGFPLGGILGHRDKGVIRSRSG